MNRICILQLCKNCLSISYFETSLVAQLVRNLPAMQETRVQSLGWEDPLEKEMATHSSILAWKISWTEEPGGLLSMRSRGADRTYWLNPQNSAGKEFTCNAEDPSLIPGWVRSTGEAIGYPLQYSWASLVAQLVKNPPAMLEAWVWSLGWEDPLEKGKATHSSILAWRVPWTMGWQRVRHNWVTCTFTLNYFELVLSVFQVYYILPHFCLFILLIFDSLMLELQPKILI